MADKNVSAQVQAKAEIIYNTAVEDCVVALQKWKSTALDGQVAVFAGANTTYRLRAASMSGSGAEKPMRFDKLGDASNYP
ncbi:MAG: hypothetical protein ABIP97_05690 [Chthoniobacterales bacterium]